jgi:hypothetical protein
MYLCAPTLLNDAFEGTAARLINFSPDMAMRLEVRRHLPHFNNENDARAFVEQHISTDELTASQVFLKEQLQNFVVKTREHSGVICFSEHFGNQRLWGTYGEEHRGACIQFWDDGGNSIVHKHARRMSYIDEDLTDVLIEAIDTKTRAVSVDALATLLYLVKSEEWADEREWRILMLADRPQTEESRFVTFPVSNVRRVFAGPRMSDATKDELRAVCRDSAYDWSFIETRTDPVTGRSTFHGVERGKGIEDLEWHSALAIPDQDSR